jgi:predicted nuclease of predicted toxin-antitoxin system
VARFLIDANLPSRLVLWHHADFELVANLGEDWPDSQVWDYAQKHNLIIVTKDADFSERIMLSSPPPRVVLLKIGNLRIAELRAFLLKVWPQIDQLSAQYKLLIVKQTTIEGIV